MPEKHDETPNSSIILAESTKDALARLAPQVERTAEFLRGASAKATLNAYEADWTSFEVWCAANKLPAPRATPEIVVLYLTHLFDIGRSPNTIVRAYSGIAATLRKGGRENNEVWAPRRRPLIVEECLRAVRRKSTHELRRKKPIGPDELTRADFGPGLVGVRNRAMLFLGFAGAFRRSELVALNVGDVEILPEGLRVTLRRSKTDQEGRTHVKGIVRQTNPDACPAAAVEAWLAGARAAGAPMLKGALFRYVSPAGKVMAEGLSARTVERIVHRAAASVGLDPKTFGGHSLRVGFVTTSAKQGASLASIMTQTGHKRVEQVRDYIRHENVFDDNASEGIFSSARRTRT